MQMSEKKVYEDLERQGFDVIVTNPHKKEKGFPDFKCVGRYGMEVYFTEVKSGETKLEPSQEKTFKEILKRDGKITIARVYQDKIIYFDLNEKLKETRLQEVTIPESHKKLFLHNCPKCNYEWEGRIEKPIACPRCKRRFDYPNQEVKQ